MSGVLAGKAWHGNWGHLEEFHSYYFWLSVLSGDLPNSTILGQLIFPEPVSLFMKWK
jgi:hypothetical protein